MVNIITAKKVFGKKSQECKTQDAISSDIFFQGLEKILTFFPKFLFQAFFPETFFPGLFYIDSVYFMDINRLIVSYPQFVSPGMKECQKMFLNLSLSKTHFSIGQCTHRNCIVL